MADPDLWWPYRWGKANLYRLKLDFAVAGQVSDKQATDFGIRKITQRRDSDTSFPEIGSGGGNFYLQSTAATISFAVPPTPLTCFSAMIPSATPPPSHTSKISV